MLTEVAFRTTCTAIEAVVGGGGDTITAATRVVRCLEEEDKEKGTVTRGLLTVYDVHECI